MTSNPYLTDPVLAGYVPPPPSVDPDAPDMVVENAVAYAMGRTDPKRGRSRRFINTVIAIIALLLAGVIAFVLLSNYQYQQDRTKTKTQLTQAQQALANEQAERAQAEAALGQTVKQLQEHGIQPSITPTATVSPQPGPAGRGILAITRTPQDHVVIVFTDGATSDLGSFVGATGAAGRGVNGVNVSASGDLVISFSDGTAADVGKVVGPAGVTGAVGATGAAGTNGSNGANGTNGSDGVPGIQGPPGVNGEPPVSWTYTDLLGASHTCQRDDPFDPSAPTYHCT